MAWRVTGSVGFLSDALESLVNLAGASFALVMVIYAHRPADRGHPWGHGKAEYFSSAFEGALIAVAAAGIMFAAIQRLAAPQALEALGLGTLLSVAATLINLAVARVLLTVGRRHRSLATEADGRHLMNDVWTTDGVIVGVALAWWTGWLWLDPAVAIVVALNILREGWGLLQRSVTGLMDGALPVETTLALQSRLRELEHRGGRFVDLRTRHSGTHQFGLVHLYVPDDWSVADADVLAAEAEQIAAEHGIRMAVRIAPDTANPPG